MPIPAATERLIRPLARESTYERIRDWIVTGQLAPGERLQNTTLAAVLGVSRMPIREAVLRLQSEGLVEIEPNRAIRVSNVRLDQAEELYSPIWALEALAVSLGAPSVTAEDIALMEKANERLRRAIAAGSGTDASDADVEFHAVIIRGAANSELARLLADLKMKLRRVEIVYFRSRLTALDSVQEHQAVIDALRRSDANAAALAVEANWRRALDRFRRTAAADPWLNRVPTA